jgi:hypothetical protein
MSTAERVADSYASKLPKERVTFTFEEGGVIGPGEVVRRYEKNGKQYADVILEKDPDVTISVPVTQLNTVGAVGDKGTGGRRKSRRRRTRRRTTK